MLQKLQRIYSYKPLWTLLEKTIYEIFDKDKTHNWTVSYVESRKIIIWIKWKNNKRATQ